MRAHTLKPTLDDERDRRRVTLLVWALVLLSVLAWAWAVRRAWTAQPVAQAPVQAPMPVAVLASAEALASALGGGAAEPAPAPEQRFKLLGVIAAASGRGVALIAVDGQPPRPYAVGAQVAPGLVLQHLAPREARLAESLQGPVRLTLPLPAWEPRSATQAAAPGTPEQGQPAPPAEATAVQPVPRGDQRGP